MADGDRSSVTITLVVWCDGNGAQIYILLLTTQAIVAVRPYYCLQTTPNLQPGSHIVVDERRIRMMSGVEWPSTLFLLATA